MIRSTVKQNDAIICLWEKSYLSKLKYFALFAGFMKRTFVECDAGKIGSHCEIVCPYPFYGKQCLSKCNCSKDHCDTANGCIGIHVFYIRSFSIYKHSKSLTRNANDIYYLTYFCHFRVDYTRLAGGTFSDFIS